MEHESDGSRRSELLELISVVTEEGLQWRSFSHAKEPARENLEWSRRI
jgi:hypothetical protein